MNKLYYSILLDDKEWAKYEGCGVFDNECTIIKGDSEIVLTANFINDPSKKQAGNLDGKVYWKEIKFLGTKRTFEIEQKTDKNIIKMLYKAKVINEDGTFNEDAIDKLVEKYGSPYSERYKRNNNTTVIIQNR